MAAQLVKELIDAGIHFGHRASRWNPKMKPYIFGKRNLIHIINVKETLKGLLLAKRFVTRTVGQNKDILIVGTKRQARKAVEDQATRVGMHWVTARWLGGTLTNFHEIRKRITRLEQLEQMEADGMLDAYSKKQGATFRREMRKIQRNLGGLRKMTRLPGALVVIDQKREMIAVKEANKLKIPVICLLDTECDPDLVDIPIPGNDDAMRAIEIIVKEICDASAEGIAGRAAAPPEPEAPAAKRRSRRATTARAETKPEAAPAVAETPKSPAPAPAEAEKPEPTAAKPAEAETPEPPAAKPAEAETPEPTAAKPAEAETPEPPATKPAEGENA